MAICYKLCHIRVKEVEITEEAIMKTSFDVNAFQQWAMGFKGPGPCLNIRKDVFS